MSDLVARWQALLQSAAPGEFLADPGHPLDIYLSKSSASLPELLIRSTQQVPPLALGQGVKVARHYRQTTNDFLLVLSLQDADLTMPFMRLSEDLIERSSRQPDAGAAMSALVDGLRDWHRLLLSARRLSQEEVRGLIAELWYGFVYLSSRFSAEQVALAWSGSLTTAQDFLFANGERHEVKSLRPGARTVTISSPEQLDSADGPILLVTVELADAAENEVGLTLPGLVREIVGALSGEALERFRQTLQERRADAGIEGGVKVRPLSVVMYDVDAMFPAVRSADVPHTVVTLQYSLSLPDLAPYRNDRKEATNDLG